jgi:uncharacterized protein YlxP (DUF503 family)
MIVGVAIFEIHIPHAQSLKEKRAVVKSLRDRVRSRFEVSAAEVALNDVHQRARLAVSFVTNDEQTVDSLFEKLLHFVETNTDAALTGWTSERLDFDETVALGVPGFELG